MTRGTSCKQAHCALSRASCLATWSESVLPAGLDRDRCSSIWDDAEFRLTFALLFYRVALFHSRSAHVRIMNVLLRGMARALQIDIGAPPLSFFSFLYFASLT